MHFVNTLIPGKFVRRKNLFVALVQLPSQEIVDVYCPNTGPLLTVLKPDAICYIEPNTNVKAKLNFTLKLVKTNNSLVGTDTHLPNKLLGEAINKKLVSDFEGYTVVKFEPTIAPHSKLDLLLADAIGNKCYVEVKNVTMSRQKGIAEFPDAVTKRGSKHLIEIMKLKSNNIRCIIFFLVQREDCHTFSCAKDIDINFYKHLQQAHNMGIEILCKDCSVTPTTINIRKSLKVVI